MKKKIAFTAVLIFMLASAGYGTYAYMTASKTAQNIITAGTVKIELNKESQQPSKASEGIKVMPETKAYREVTVKNIGENDCYVRVKLITYVKSPTDTQLPTAGLIILNTDVINWVQDSEGYWRYTKKLAPGETSSNLLTEIVFDKLMDNEYQNATFNLSVSAQAVQTANNGFATSVLDVKGWPYTPVPSPSDAG